MPEAAATTTRPTGGGGIGSSGGSNSGNRPPAQVFTRGTTGAVKTRRRPSNDGNNGVGTSSSGQPSFEAPPRGRSSNYGAGGGKSPRSTSSAPAAGKSRDGGTVPMASPSSSTMYNKHYVGGGPEAATATSSTPSGVSSLGSHYTSATNPNPTPPHPPQHPPPQHHNGNYNVNNRSGRSDSNDMTMDGAGSVHSAPSYGSNPASSVGGGGNGGGGGGGSRVSASSYGNNNYGGRKDGMRNDRHHHYGGQHQQQYHHSNSNRYGRDTSPTRSHDSDKAHSKTARRVLDDLSRAQGSERRIAALTYVCECFDHNDEVKHNVELSMGALQVLSKCLLVATHDDEVRMTCAAFEMVLRASPRTVQLAYGKVGGTSLIMNLLRILERCEVIMSMNHAEISILNINKVLAYLSRCPEARPSLSRQQGVLESLTRVATTSSAECRMARMRCLANLANCEENKVLLYEHEGLVPAVVRIAHLDDSELARQHAAAVLMDLASAPQNQVSMASDDRVLGCLVKMTLVEKATSTRESVITALQNLAFCKESRNRLVSFKDGVLLEALRNALASDSDAKARRRAAGALTNLVCEDTAERMGRQKGLLDTLAVVTTKDDNSDVQTRASLALTKIANLITVRMECHETLLDALVVASLSKANNSVSAVLRIKARDADNRERMARHPGVMDTLADICVSDAARVGDRDNAMRAIMHLINEDRNRKILCNKTVLDALVAGANYREPDLEEARDSAVRAMERLATEHTNRETMARHPGLLTAVAQAVEREAKWEDAGRESEHGYLAKPLLMSLLVAM